VMSGLLALDSPARRMLVERSVIMGGMRALLMQAVHPVVASAIEKAGTYHKDPWDRHARTLRLMLVMFLAEPSEALAAIRLINLAHRMTSGTDPLSGESRRANDPNLLLWVHASLVSSFLLFERLTVGALDDADHQRVYHDLAGVATLLGIPRPCIPANLEDLVSYVDDVVVSGVLRSTVSSQKLHDAIMRDAPLTMKVRLRSAAFLSLHTLPEPIRSLYAVEHADRDERRLRMLSQAMRWGRHIVPRRLLLIDPHQALVQSESATKGHS
jgi:uncharacterized protein (DUF2236 family)